ncbi:MAG: putative thiol:disulfide interchange protein DsbC precursor [Syntrophorhabdaceae bacterium PtaU1.Bin034]|nr:MAG: putative thiol:disulfide interchange protein DsbC precursor [Syntrophorhabdaceae bacterium PtaU1.Bin034]
MKPDTAPLTILLFVFVALLIFSAPVHAFREGSQSCTKCHTLSDRDMAPILEKINMAAAKVLSIRMSPIKGLWEASIENKGQRFVIYVDFAKKYVSPGPLIDYANRRDVTRERIEELNRDRKVNMQGLSLQNALLLGKADAPIKVVVFTDPNCSYCARLHQEMKKIVEKRPDISFYMKLFLLNPNPANREQATSIICSKAEPMLRAAFEKKPIPKQECATGEIDENLKFGEENGINATPAVIFPDGTIQMGYSDAAQLEKRIDEAAARQKKPAEAKKVK